MKTEKICPVCSKTFKVWPSGANSTYCSRGCYLTDSTQEFRKKTPGGYRPGSGRSKSGYYRGIYCGSTYELCWVIYNLDHGVSFTRFEGCIEGNGVKYYPDFLIDDRTIIEIKGYEAKESVDRKTKLAESLGYNVIVLRREQLADVFDYVKSKYTSEFQTLYDDYRPKYEYTCCHCNEQFSRDKKLRTEVVFCSRGCAGKGHLGNVKRKRV